MSAARSKPPWTRHLNGTPLRSDGKLTILSLAAEAGVKRAREFTGPRPLAQLEAYVTCWRNPDAAGLTSAAESSVHRCSHSAIKPSRT
jgi:hypothetical protein